MTNVINIKVNDDQLKRARSLYDFGALKGSITGGKSNIYGALGEVVVHDFFTGTGRDVIHDSTPDYDMKISGKRFDIKTKRTTVPPSQGYNCSIAAYNVTQECDYYLFVRVHESLKEAWILGYIDKGEFYKKAKFYREGDADPKFPSWNFTADCYNLEVRKLNSIKSGT
jgi:hypothetical protein